MKLLGEFKDFIKRGNVIDLAVAIIIGGAFKAIISSLVADIVMPFISLILGNVDITNLKVVLKQAAGDAPELAIRYGLFIQNIIDFIIIAFVVFMMIKGINKLNKKKEEEEEPVVEEDPAPTEAELLTEIRDLLSKK